MSYLIINGGKKLHGTIMNQSAKNSALAILCACLLIKGKTVLTDVPQIEEINRMIEFLSSIGVKITKLDQRKLLVDTSGRLSLANMDKTSASSMPKTLETWSLKATALMPE